METLRKVVAGLVAITACLIYIHASHAAAPQLKPSYSTGTSISSSGAYCCAPKMSGSPGLPLGRVR